MNETKKLSNKTIFGYGFGAMADAAAYNFYIMYALYFLTSIAGLSAGKAGAVLSVATVITAVVGVVLGPISDNTRSRFGRRRPYLLAGGVVLMAGLILFFKPMAFSDNGKFLYYMAMFIIMNVGYGVFLIPYNALGAELTNDYNERTKLRTPATFMNCVGNIIGISLPLTAVAAFTKAGASEGNAWNYFAVIVGAVCLAAILIAWGTTKGKELPKESLEAPEERELNPLKTYWRILKLKPFKWVIGILILFAIGYIAFQSGLIYYILFYAGLSEAQMSTAMFIYIFICMGWTIVISLLAAKINKKKGMAFCFLISAAGMAALYFAGVHSFGMLILLLAVFGMGNAAYWLLIYPIIYDLAEVYEYKYGKRKEGTLMSMYGCIFTLSTALGTQVLTIMLTMVGYNPQLPVQSETTINGIANIVLGIPIITFVFGAFCSLAYPLSKRTFEKLMQQLEAKRAGEPADESELERII